jgi:hypothetical protein
LISIAALSLFENQEVNLFHFSIFPYFFPPLWLRGAKYLRLRREERNDRSSRRMLESIADCGAVCAARYASLH